MNGVLKVVDNSEYVSFLNEVDFDDSIPLVNLVKIYMLKKVVTLVIQLMDQIWLGQHGKTCTIKKETLLMEHQLKQMKFI